MSFENKLVAIMNKSIEPGVSMNALAHLALGFGAHIGAERLHLTDYVTQEGLIYPNISKMPFIILQANSNKIKNLIVIAREKKLEWSAFTDTMTVGSWQEQLKRTGQKNDDELIFYGLVLFGEWNLVSEITRKLSLWK